MNALVQGYLSLLHSNGNLKELLPAKAFSTICRCNKDSKEFLSPSLYPNSKIIKISNIISCNSCIVCMKIHLLLQLLLKNIMLKMS